MAGAAAPWVKGAALLLLSAVKGQVHLSSYGHKQSGEPDGPHFGNWTVDPVSSYGSSVELVENPEPFVDGGDKPMFAAWWCIASYDVGDSYLQANFSSLARTYSLVSANYVADGFNAACEGFCAFDNGTSTAFDNGYASGTFPLPAACEGATRVFLRGGGLCGWCLLEDIYVMETTLGSSASAGDDPIFVGADGVSYEVRGEPWRYFNLLSMPHSSLNAQFLPVSDRFVGAAGSLSLINDTVLGSLHLALCEPPSGKMLGLLFDVTDGSRKCTSRQGSDGAPVPTPCGPALAAAGVNLTEELSACSVATMGCGFLLADTDIAAAVAANPALVAVAATRLNLSTSDGLRLSLVRDVIDRPEPRQPAGWSAADCAPLAPWARAARACEAWQAALRGEAAAWSELPAADRIAVAAFLTAGNASRQFPFYNVRLDAVPLEQAQVHGLLGQRAVRPAPLRAAPRPPAAEAQPFVEAAVMGGGGGSGASAAGTVRAPVGVGGPHQGEGAIEGSFRDYQVRWISSHGPEAFPHSRFVCGAPPSTFHLR